MMQRPWRIDTYLCCPPDLLSLLSDRTYNNEPRDEYSCLYVHFTGDHLYWPSSQCTPPWQRLFSCFLNIPQCPEILCAGLRVL